MPISPAKRSRAQARTGGGDGPNPSRPADRAAVAREPVAFDRRQRDGARRRPGSAGTAARASAHRRAARGCLLIGLLAGASTAAAQPAPARTDLPVGEGYRVELAGTLWGPAQELTIGSLPSGPTTSASGAPGAFAPRFLDARLRLRLSRRQQVHLDYLPVRYAADTALDGRPAPDGPVASTLTWKTWRVAYEYDVIHRARGSLGLFAEAGYSDVRVARTAAPGTSCGPTAAGCELARMRRPVPGVGGVVRLYPSPVIMLGAEASLLRTPPGVGRLLDYTGEHVAYDVHATLNFVEGFGLQVGHRSRRLHLKTAGHDADLKLEGLYVGALLRF